MSAGKERPMGLDRKEIDDKILDELHDGRNVPSNLADELDVTRQYVSQRLALLEAADHVHNVGRGVYELVDDPREDVEYDSSHSQEYVQELEERNQELGRETDRLREQLAKAYNDSGIDVDHVCSSVKTAFRALEERQPSVDLARSELETALEECDRAD